MQPKKIEKINAHFSLVRGEMTPQQQQAAALVAAFYLFDAPTRGSRGLADAEAWWGLIYARLAGVEVPADLWRESVVGGKSFASRAALWAEQALPEDVRAFCPRSRAELLALVLEYNLQHFFNAARRVFFA